MATDEARRRRWELYHERFPETFWTRVDKSAGPDACWPYLGTRRANGYGRLRLNGKYELAHRLAFQFSSGAPAGGMMVCHACDNPPCCNPAHLFLGDHAANMRDRADKGRAPLHLAKLNPKQVLAIRSRLKSGASGATLAAEYGVSQTAISRIKLGKTWNAALRARMAHPAKEGETR